MLLLLLLLLITAIVIFFTYLRKLKHREVNLLVQIQPGYEGPGQNVGCVVLPLRTSGAVLSGQDTQINKVCFPVNPESIWATNLTEVQFLVRGATGKAGARYS